MRSSIKGYLRKSAEKRDARPIPIFSGLEQSDCGSRLIQIRKLPANFS
jgi:hypothetical protein